MVDADDKTYTGQVSTTQYSAKERMNIMHTHAKERESNNNLQGLVEVLVHLHNGRLVAAAVAVVGGAEDSHHVHRVRPVVAVHHQLVRAGHQAEAVAVVEHLRDVAAEGVAGASGGDAPAAPLVGVGPQQVAHGALVRHLLHAVQLPDVVQRVDGGGQAAVQAEDVVVDDSSQGQVVEQVCEVLPHVARAIFPYTLVEKAVYLRDLPAFVVSTE